MSGARYFAKERERRRAASLKEAREYRAREAASARPAEVTPPPEEKPTPNLRRGVREWYDYGKDTGPRLRVKGIVDADSLPIQRPEPPSNVDPRDVEEVHRRSREAMAEGDDQALGKIYEDLLDTLHSESIPTTDEDPIERIRLDLRAKELGQALGVELAELGRGRRWQVGYRLEQSGGGEIVLVVGVKDKATGIPWLCTVDQRALLAAVRRAGSEPRLAAREIATRVRAEVDKARAGANVGAN